MVDSKILSLMKLTNPSHLLNYIKKNWLFKGNTITSKGVVFIEVRKVKDPNWPEVNQLAFYKRIQGDELENKSA